MTKPIDSCPATQIGDGNSVEIVTAEVLEIYPTPRKRLRIGTVAECKRELAKLYIDARRGKIPTATATRLAYLLQVMVTMIKDHEIEERVAVLEAESQRR